MADVCFKTITSAIFNSYSKKMKTPCLRFLNTIFTTPKHHVYTMQTICL